MRFTKGNEECNLDTEREHPIMIIVMLDQLNLIDRHNNIHATSSLIDVSLPFVKFYFECY